MEHYSSGGDGWSTTVVGEMDGVLQQWRRWVEYYSSEEDWWSTTVVGEMSGVLQ